MTNQELADYRGSLVYTQEYGYKLVTMTVSVAPNEQSHITSHAYNVPLTEEAEHLQGIDCITFRSQMEHRYSLPLIPLQGVRKHGIPSTLILLSRNIPLSKWILYVEIPFIFTREYPFYSLVFLSLTLPLLIQRYGMTPPRSARPAPLKNQATSMHSV